MDEVVYIDTIAEVQPVHSIVAIDEEILTTSTPFDNSVLTTLL